MSSPLARRLTQAMSEMPGNVKQADLARATGVKPGSVGGWFSGRTQKLGKALVPAAKFLNVNPEWLNEGKLPMRPIPGPVGSVRVAEPSAEYGASFEILMLEAPGSCGNGRGDMEEYPKTIVMGASWFSDRSLNADDLFAVRADGDANADYITHGDIVIFDSTKTTPISGKIFLIQHPDGLRIRRLRREMDSTWVLEYLSNDKVRWPDDRIATHQIDLLRIEGQFVYRQGG